MRPVFLLVLSLLFCGSSARADAFASSDLHPLLRAHATRSFIEGFSQLRLDDQDYLISRGGALLSQVAGQVDGGSFSNFLVRGAGDREHLAALKRVLAESQVGTLKSCEIDSGGVTNGPYEITWYGKEGRRNSFVAVLGPAGASGLPPCPPQVGNIIQAISVYVNHVVSLPGTEILQAR